MTRNAWSIENQNGGRDHANAPGKKKKRRSSKEERETSTRERKLAYRAGFSWREKAGYIKEKR